MSRKDIVDELHKYSRKNFPRRRVIVKGVNDLWQADLVEMIPYAGENKNYKYLLTVIDVFSKFAFALPVKQKSGVLVTQALDRIFQAYKHTPRNLQTDLGKEFYNSSFKKLMNDHNINHYSTFSVLKASVVERFNRTLKERMWKSFSVQGSYKWLPILQNLIKDYNSTVHRTIGVAPIKVTKDVEKKLLNTVFKYNPKIVKSKYKIGDYVRISKFKKVFEKGYTPNWSTEIFKIVHINNKFPVTYLVEDYQHHPIAGGFYEYELQKAKHPNVYLVEKILKRKGNQIFVKWLGFDNSHNSWISEKSFV